MFPGQVAQTRPQGEVSRKYEQAATGLLSSNQSQVCLVTFGTMRLRQE